jgi:hypothetical protein
MKDLLSIFGCFLWAVAIVLAAVGGDVAAAAAVASAGVVPVLLALGGALPGAAALLLTCAGSMCVSAAGALAATITVIGPFILALVGGFFAADGLGRRRIKAQASFDALW